MKDLEIFITHIKILSAISSLNKKNLYPLSDGVYKIVAGIVDDETQYYQDEPAFGTLISFSSKKVCRYLLALQRHKYIQKIYSKPHDCLAYSTTELGEDTLNNYLKKHKKGFIKKKRTIKTTIIKI